MKKLRFKSLTMQIWMTFTVIILVIILGISLFYGIAYRKINEKAQTADLIASHSYLMKNKGFDLQTPFDQLSNLKDSHHFIYNKNASPNISEINKSPNRMKVNRNPPITKDFNLFTKGFNLLNPPIFSTDSEIENWMISYISDSSSLYEKEFKATYKNISYIFIITSIDDKELGKYYLISYMPNIQDNKLLYDMFLIGLFFIIISFIASKLVANHISKPLKQLEKYTFKIARKDWNDPITINSNDEIGRLAAAMNHMRSELQHADEEEKMFLQSISHDLKTPVMVIMSHADAIIDGVYIDSPEKTAEIIRDEAISLEKKIKQILYLNTLDYVLENNAEISEIYINKLILHIISRFEVIDSKIEWDLNLDEIAIWGNEDKLKVSIENVLENGLRYAKEKISIFLKKENGNAILEIYNDGPNIKPEHIGHIFDNLYKDKTGNFGLGLAITKKIIDFHHGQIHAINRDTGVSFIIKLPVNKSKLIK